MSLGEWLGAAKAEDEVEDDATEAVGARQTHTIAPTAMMTMAAITAMNTFGLISCFKIQTSRSGAGYSQFSASSSVPG